ERRAVLAETREMPDQDANQFTFAFPKTGKQLALFLRGQQVGGKNGGGRIQNNFFNYGRGDALTTTRLHHPSFQFLGVSPAEVATASPDCRPRLSVGNPTALATRSEREGGRDSFHRAAPFARLRSTRSP